MQNSGTTSSYRLRRSTPELEYERVRVQLPRKTIFGNVVTINDVQYVQTRTDKLIRYEPHMKVVQNRYQEKRPYCRFYNRTGICQFGERCLNVHDPNRVVMCRFFLRGRCADPLCMRSHTPSPYRSPLCSHFEAGDCTRDDCPFLHVKLSPLAPTCLEFLREGYCIQGASCSQRHVLECPEWSEYGVCTNLKCPYLHVRKPKQDNFHQHGKYTARSDHILPVAVPRPNFSDRSGDFLAFDTDDTISVNEEHQSTTGIQCANSDDEERSGYIEIEESDEEVMHSRHGEDDDDLLAIFDGVYTEARLPPPVVNSTTNTNSVKQQVPPKILKVETSGTSKVPLSKARLSLRSRLGLPKTMTAEYMQEGLGQPSADFMMLPDESDSGSDHDG